MELEGLHHITMVTGDAQATVGHYADTLGLRLVKKTVNFDDPSAYHLYFGDETGAPGSILTWFEFAGARPGRAGNGMVHTIQLGVGTEDALSFWEQRLAARHIATERTAGALAFTDHDGLGLELVVADDGNAPLTATHPDVPAEHAIRGVEGVRAYALFSQVPDGLLTDVLGFTHEGEGRYRLQGPERHLHFTWDQAQTDGQPGAGTVHHIAFASRDEDHLPWQARVRQAGGIVTEVQDRDYFDAIYFRVPQGVLFELATLSPGFATDEEPEHLGEALRLPAQHEHLRAQLERTLEPVTNPRTQVIA